MASCLVTYKSHKKTFVILFLVVVAVVLCFVFLFFLGTHPRLANDVVTVSCVSTYNKTDSTVVICLVSYENEAHIFNKAIFKNSEGQQLAMIDLIPSTLPAYGNLNMTINLAEGVLSSDNSYRVELYTTEDKCYSSYLTYYEAVHTQATIVDTNTLLVEIQSLSSQTITFDKATINYWVTAQFNSDSTSQIQQSEDIALNSNNIIAPNGNLSFNLPFQRGFTSGTYSLILHPSSPNNVDGAWTVFRAK